MSKPSRMPLVIAFLLGATLAGTGAVSVLTDPHASPSPCSPCRPCGDCTLVETPCELCDEEPCEPASVCDPAPACVWHMENEYGDLVTLPQKWMSDGRSTADR